MRFWSSTISSSREKMKSYLLPKHGILGISKAKDLCKLPSAQDPICHRGPKPRHKEMGRSSTHILNVWNRDTNLQCCSPPGRVFELQYRSFGPTSKFLLYLLAKPPFPFIVVFFMAILILLSQFIFWKLSY